MSRASATPMDSPAGVTTSTSGWLPARTVWQEEQWPQPPSGHCSAAANARAATDRPDPGGPVNSHACVKPWACSTPRGLDRLLAAGR